VSHLQRLYGRKKERRKALWKLFEDVEEKRRLRNIKKQQTDEEKAKAARERAKGRLKDWTKRT